MQKYSEAVSQILAANKNVPIGCNALAVNGTVLHNSFKISQNSFYNVASEELTIYCNITNTITTVPLSFGNVTVLNNIITTL